MNTKQIVIAQDFAKQIKSFLKASCKKSLLKIYNLSFHLLKQKPSYYLTLLIKYAKLIQSIGILILIYQTTDI